MKAKCKIFSMCKNGLKTCKHKNVQSIKLLVCLFERSKKIVEYEKNKKLAIFLSIWHKPCTRFTEYFFYKSYSFNVLMLYYFLELQTYITNELTKITYNIMLFIVTFYIKIKN